MAAACAPGPLDISHLGININALDVKRDDPGLVIAYGTAPAVHACLGQAGCPVPQGADADASLLNLRAWVHQRIVAAVGVGCQESLAGGGFSDALFHRMSAGDVMLAQAALFVGPWRAAMVAAGASCGSLFLVTAAGGGANEAEQVPAPLCGPFVG